MTTSRLLCMLFLLITLRTYSQNIPEGYILQYQQSFSHAKALNDFDFSNPQAWGISKSKNNYYLQFRNDSTYKPEVLSPEVMGILNDYTLGDFIMEVDVMPLGSDSVLNEICIFLSIKDSLQYYYIQLANTTNENTNGIFLVKNAPLKKIAGDTLNSFFLSNNTWHKLRIERNIMQRTIKVFYKDMSKPVMETKNYELVMGYIGFGSFSGSGCIDNIKIWAPTSIPGKTEIFKELGN